MAANCFLNIQNKNLPLADKIDFIPFSVKSDCKAPIDKYFRKIIRTNQNNEFVSSYRGRQFRGKKLQIPFGYKGLVVKKVVEQSNDKSNHMNAVKQFEELTYWNWDKSPSLDDHIIGALDWIDISNAVHEQECEDERVSQ